MIDIIFEDSTSIPDLVQQALLRINPEYKRVCNFKILGGCGEVNSYIRELHGNPEHPIIVFADSTTINIDIRKKTEKYSNLHITQIGCLEYYIFNYTPFRNIAISEGKDLFGMKQ